MSRKRFRIRSLQSLIGFHLCLLLWKHNSNSVEAKTMKGFQVAALLGWSLSPIVAFQTRVSLSSSRKPSPRLFAIDPTHFIQHDVSLWTDSSALTYLADAAAGVLDPNTATGALQDAGTAVENVMQAAASTEIEIAKDEGWWQAYLNIFKETLNLIHNTIDEPLRNNGVTQTWGISIALFTASEFDQSSRIFIFLSRVSVSHPCSVLMFSNCRLSHAAASSIVTTNKKF